MKREEIIKKIIEYFEENTEEFNELVEALDAWNGYLGDDRMYPMEELNDIYNGLVFYDYIDYSDRLDEYAVKAIAENLDNIDVCLSEELEELFDELKEEA